jgi:hypothetical protein
MNAFQHKVANSLLAGSSAGRYQPRSFEATHTFRTIAQAALRQLKISSDNLVPLRYLSADEAKTLRKIGVNSIGDLFKPELLTTRPVDAPWIRMIRTKIVDRLLDRKQTRAANG